MEPPKPRLSANRVLFACTHNAGRSQIAAAFFNLLADQEKAMAVSAGTQPAPLIHPEVMDAMREVGIDLSAKRPRLLTRELAAQSTLLITMGCRESCPVIAGQHREDWDIPDPQGQPPIRVRAIRDALLHLVKDLVKRREWGKRTG